MQQLLLTLHSFHYGVLHREKETHGLNKRLGISTCLEVVCKVQAETVLRPGVIMATETGGEEENAGINNPPLAAAASDSVAAATSKLLTESLNHLSRVLTH